MIAAQVRGGLVVGLDLDVGSRLTEEGVGVLALGELGTRRVGNGLSEVRLSSGKGVKLRRKLARRGNLGRLGGLGRVEVSHLTLVGVGGLERETKMSVTCRFDVEIDHELRIGLSVGRPWVSCIQCDPFNESNRALNERT